MFGNNKTFLSIDMGNRNIKLVKGRTIGKKVEILAYEIIDTPINSLSDGKIIDSLAIAKVIKDAINESKLYADKVILTAAGTGIITRDIQLPKATHEEIAKIIEYEAQQYFPVDLGNYILDFKVLEEVTNVDGVFYRILLVALPIKQSEDYMKIPELLKMDVESIDLPANCVLKFLFSNNYLNFKPGESNSDMPKEFAVLDIGADTTGVCIFCNNKLKFNRVLLTGSSDIDKRIAQEFNLDFKEAESNKIFKARIDDETEKWEISEDVEEISKLAKESISTFADDLARFFDFYNSRSAENNIEKIYICGGGSKLQGITNYLSSSFNIPVGFVCPTQHIEIEYKGSKDYEELNRDFVFLINAIGALIRG